MTTYKYSTLCQIAVISLRQVVTKLVPPFSGTARNVLTVSRSLSLFLTLILAVYKGERAR